MTNRKRRRKNNLDDNSIDDKIMDKNNNNKNNNNNNNKNIKKRRSPRLESYIYTNGDICDCSNNNGSNSQKECKNNNCISDKNISNFELDNLINTTKNNTDNYNFNYNNKSKILTKKRKKYTPEQISQYNKLKEFNEAIKKSKLLSNNDHNEHTDIVKFYKQSVIQLDTTIENKIKIYERIVNLANMNGTENEYPKLKQWITTILSVPFGKYNSLPYHNTGIFNNESDSFMINSYNELEKSIYGQQNAKNKILQIIVKWISNPQSSGNVLGFSGSKGVGKTSLASQGLSEALNRPCYIIKLGALTDASYLEGHGYTYDGAICGRIIDILREAKCMNPIIFFDELDKLSETEKGREIIGYLIHLTDFTENNRYQEDKYFSGISFDLSRILFIFSYNYPERIDPILKDRIDEIEFQTFDEKEKSIIVQKYLLPTIHKNLGIKMIDGIKPIIQLPPKSLEYMIQYIDSESIRNLKCKIESIYSKIQLLLFMSLDTIDKINISNKFRISKETKLPLVITKKMIDEYIN